MRIQTTILLSFIAVTSLITLSAGLGMALVSQTEEKFHLLVQANPSLNHTGLDELSLGDAVAIIISDSSQTDLRTALYAAASDTLNDSPTVAPILVIFLISSAGVIAIGIFLSRRISKPFYKLLLTTKAIARGKYEGDTSRTGTAAVSGYEGTQTADIKRIRDMNKDELSQLFLALEEINQRLVQQQAELQSTNEMLSIRNNELAEVNEKLQALDRMKTDFINIAAHELKNPIQPLMGLSFMVKKGVMTNEHGWDIVERQAKLLRHIAESILDVSRIENGIFSYEMKPMSIAEPIRNVVDALTPLPQDIPIEIEMEQSKRDLMLLGDEKRLVQVLTNLISNALRFTTRGRILVSVRPLTESNGSRDEQIEIRVSDTGSGIPPDICPVLFNKFVTKSGSKGSGTGLGLFIAKSIIEAHKGTIAAENNADGVGATFTIILPALHQLPVDNPVIQDSKIQAAASSPASLSAS